MPTSISVLEVEEVALFSVIDDNGYIHAAIPSNSKSRSQAAAVSSVQTLVTQHTWHIYYQDICIYVTQE